MAAQLPGRTAVFRMRPRARGQGRPLPAVLAAGPPRIPARPPAAGEARGWKRGIRLGVRRALIIVLSGHAAGDTVCYSGIFPALRARDISAGRAAGVLQEMGVLADDRRPSFEGWLDRKPGGLADGIGREAGWWLRTMRDGGPRSRARSIETVRRHMNNVRAALLDWSRRYDHLREVTRDDIQAILRR